MWVRKISVDKKNFWLENFDKKKNLGRKKFGNKNFSFRKISVAKNIFFVSILVFQWVRKILAKKNFQ